jgi:hypothetical protein
MGELLQKLREGKIVSPCSYKFDESNFEKICSKLTLDKEDDKIIFAVKFVRQKHAGIRKFSEKQLEKKVKAKDVILGLIGSVNRSRIVISEGIVKNLESKKNLTGGDIITGGVHNLLGGINTASGDQIAQTIVEAIKYPLMHAVRTLIDIKTTDRDYFLKTIWVHDNLAGMHDATNEIWTGVLYGMYNLYEFDNMYFCHPQSIDLITRYQISMLRRRARSFEIMNIVYDMVGMKNLPHHKVMKIEGSGKEKTVKTRVSNNDEMLTFATMLMSIDDHLDDAIDYKLPEAKDITLRQLFLAQAMIQGLLKDIMKRIGPENGAYCMKTLTCYAPSFFGVQLLRCIRSIPDITNDQAIFILDLFTYSFDGWDVDMMTKFFVKFDNKYYPILAAFSPEPSFIAGHWLKIGGYPLASRGGAFEKSIREKFADISKDFLLTSVQNHTNYKINDAEEEIDLVFLFGTILYVCEIKCSFWVNSNHDWHILRTKLTKACSQCERKAKFVKDNLDEFMRLYLNGNFSDEVRTLVISNECAFTGHRIENTYITDEKALMHFFDNKSCKISGVDEENRELIPYDLLKHYDSPGVASAQFEKYISCPPQHTYHTRALHLTAMYTPAISHSDKSILRYDITTK